MLILITSCMCSGRSLLWNLRFKITKTTLSALFVILKHITGKIDSIFRKLDKGVLFLSTMDLELCNINFRYPRLLSSIMVIIIITGQHDWVLSDTKWKTHIQACVDKQWSDPPGSVISPLWRKFTFIFQILRLAGSFQSKQRNKISPWSGDNTCSWQKHQSCSFKDQTRNKAEEVNNRKGVFLFQNSKMKWGRKIWEQDVLIPGLRSWRELFPESQ